MRHAAGEIIALCIAKARDGKASCGSRAAILMFSAGAARRPRRWRRQKFPLKLCRAFRPSWPRRITRAFPSPTASIAPASRSLPATAIRRMRPPACTTNKSPKFPAPRLCSWARKIWLTGQIAHRARHVRRKHPWPSFIGHDRRQKSVAGTLATIAALAAKEKLSPPALTVIGDVVKLRGKLNWFETSAPVRPAHRRHPRPGQAGDFAHGSRNSARTCWKFRPSRPCRRPTGRTIVDALLELNAYDWLVFTSANGVTAFFDFFSNDSRTCATSAARGSPRSARPRRPNCGNCICRWI